MKTAEVTDQQKTERAEKIKQVFDEFHKKLREVVPGIDLMTIGSHVEAEVALACVDGNGYKLAEALLPCMKVDPNIRRIILMACNFYVQNCDTPAPTPAAYYKNTSHT